MKKLLSNQDGDMNMILAAVTMAIVFVIGIIIIFNVYAALDTSTIDASLASNLGHNASLMTDAGNATDDLLTNTETFFTVGPIALIVVAAVGILSYVLLLRRRQ